MINIVKIFILIEFNQGEKMRILGLIFLIIFAANAIALSEQKLIENLELQNVVVFSHVVDKEGTPKGEGAEILKIKIKELSKSKTIVNYTELQVYPNSLLFDDVMDTSKKSKEQLNDVMDALKNNKVQLAAPSISKLVEYNQKLMIFDLPFLFKNIKEVKVFYDKSKKKLFDEGIYLDENKRYLVLSLWHNGMKLVSTNIIPNKERKPLHNIKFRIQPSEIIEFTFTSLGADTNTKIPFKDVYKKLKKKKVDGQENTWSNIYTKKFHDVQQYIIETNHSYLGYLLITNNNFWEKELKGYNQQVLCRQPIELVENTINQEPNSLAAKLNNKAKEKIINDKDTNIKLITFTERDNWCNEIYHAKNFKKWVDIVKSKITEELIEIAIENKTGCPYDFLRRIVETSK